MTSQPSPTAAVAAATRQWSERFPQLAASAHFRKAQLGPDRDAWQVSSLGIGTYLGEPDDATDALYAETLRAALDGGINLIDTASNYRHQRSERLIGRVLAERREQRPGLVVCTKAGYLPFDGEMPAEPRAWLAQTYLQTGLVPGGQLAGGGHCMAPVFLAHQLQRSLDNLGLATIDVFYIHNPETQQAELSREEFHRRLQAAFELLERAASEGRIQYYGVATWSGFRVPPDAREYLDLNRMVGIAREVAGDSHRFRFVQLPYNLAMPEAYVLMNQYVGQPPYVSLLNAAYRLGVNVVASAALMNGRLQALPGEARAHLATFLPAAATDAELALQFVRSTPGVLSALVGMSRLEHLAVNLRAASVAPAPPAQIGRLLQQ